MYAIVYELQMSPHSFMSLINFVVALQHGIHHTYLLLNLFLGIILGYWLLDIFLGNYLLNMGIFLNKYSLKIYLISTMPAILAKLIPAISVVKCYHWHLII